MSGDQTVGDRVPPAVLDEMGIPPHWTFDQVRLAVELGAATARRDGHTLMAIEYEPADVRAVAKWDAGWPS